MENFFVTFFYSDYSTSPIDKFELDGKRKTKREKNEIKTKKNSNKNDQSKFFAHRIFR